jgi:hypothetical protein
LLRTIVFVLFKEPHIYADVLQVTSRCAIRGKKGLYSHSMVTTSYERDWNGLSMKEGSA